MQHIGKFKHNISVASEYAALSKEDEAAANILATQKHYRQACILLVQAMEKAIRAKIFTLVNPNLDYFREKNKHHSLDAAVEFLIEIVSTDSVIKGQILAQLNTHVLENTQYNHLHNNLRYPSYFKRYDSYSLLEIQREDFNRLRNRLISLRKFLDELGRLS
ncbi:MAG: HEPN domain-containing protein [Caldilineaceae bacterium]|nr:HEPN domain-containing protein [Caldilineaceae bacterium]